MTDKPTLPPNKLAFVIDGGVVDVLHTDDRLAAIFLSQPTIVDVTALYEEHEEGFNIVAWKYNAESNEFTSPEVPTNG